MTNQPLALTGAPLTLADVESVARTARHVELAPDAIEAIERSNRWLNSALDRGDPIYGVNTGFGSLANTRIERDQIAQVQTNLIRSHAAGVGDPLEPSVVRAMMLLLAASLSRGHSGVRPVVVETIVRALNASITPLVPARGSVGASGDLAPLSHVVLALLGEGEVLTANGSAPSRAALDAAGIPPLTLEAKEGLALINGTHLMAAQGVHAVLDAERLFDAAIGASAMSIDACRGTDSYLDDRVYDIRNQPGPRAVAARVWALLEGSQIIPSHLHDDPRVQDPYSLRCVAPVLGAVHDCIAYVRAVIGHELGAVTDNPLVFDPQDLAHSRTIVSAGNFHGMPLALPVDALAPAITHIAGISERRVYYILAASDAQNPLHAHLSPQPGLHSGLMITQYTAAALVNELITLSTPASVSNIPTCAGMEDYNSFGPRSAAKAREAIRLATDAIAIELICGAEAMEYQRPLRSGPGVERVYELVRSVVPRLTEDRSPTPDIRAIAGLIRSGEFAFTRD
ncbi:MAG: histidine ammonia-lyase [Planctomycetota bacterium]